MRLVIQKPLQLGAKPTGSLSVEETRRGPTPAAAVKAVLQDQGKDPAALVAAMGVRKQDMTYPTAGSTQTIRIYTPGVPAGRAPAVIACRHLEEFPFPTRRQSDSSGLDFEGCVRWSSRVCLI